MLINRNRKQNQIIRVPLTKSSHTEQSCQLYREKGLIESNLSGTFSQLKWIYESVVDVALKLRNESGSAFRMASLLPEDVTMESLWNLKWINTEF